MTFSGVDSITIDRVDSSGIAKGYRFRRHLSPAPEEQGSFLIFIVSINRDKVALVREYMVPAVSDIPADANLTDAVFDNAQKYPDTVVFSRGSEGDWQEVTAAQFAHDVSRVAKGLIAAGIQPGDRVALMSRTRYEWTLCDYAIWTAGAVTVPIYPSASPEQTRWILHDSAAVAAIVETAKHSATVEDARVALPSLQHRWEIEDNGVSSLIEIGASVQDANIDDRRAVSSADSLATIIYTSGTTGSPKGCELSHRNLLTDIAATTTVLRDLLVEPCATLLFLPLAHVFARIFQCDVVATRCRTAFASDTSRILDDLAEFRPTFLVAVPRVFEKLFNGARQRAHDSGKGRIFDAAERTAIAYSRSLDTGGPGLMLRSKHALFDRLVYRKLRAALGGRCTRAVSGGAPLGERLGHFYRGIGITVFEGYGLTESTAGLTLNCPDAIKIGTVGRPTPGASIRISHDGEIFAKGDIIFSGYWNNQAGTEMAFDDGWFRTGDLGELDEHGYLRITGRKKEIIVTASGKNVAPAILEDRIRAHALISQCMVVGDQRPFITCLLTLDEDMIAGWKRTHRRAEETPVSEIRNDPLLRAEIQSVIDEANSTVSKAEAIKKFHILDHDFTEENGELTASLKLKRNIVLAKYAEELAALYR